MPPHRIPIRSTACPVCTVGMKRHCSRPDCEIWVCAGCPLWWDAKVQRAYSRQPHHEEFARP